MAASGACCASGCWFSFSSSFFTVALRRNNLKFVNGVLVCSQWKNLATYLGSFHM
jgi:hypothetical protein